MPITNGPTNGAPAFWSATAARQRCFQQSLRTALSRSIEENFVSRFASHSRKANLANRRKGDKENVAIALLRRSGSDHDLEMAGRTSDDAHLDQFIQSAGSRRQPRTRRKHRATVKSENRPLLAYPRTVTRGRKHFAAAMALRRAGEQDGEFKAIRRGWCLGNAAFRQELLDQMHEQRGPNHYGEERF